MRLISNIFQVLNSREKQKMVALSFWALLISIADIASLAVLIYIVGFYSQGTVPPAFKFLPKSFQDSKSISLILVFLILFAAKNLGGYLVFRAQYKFVYQVATRLAELNLLQFLEGRFTDYIEVDSSVQVRRISQQPIEFCHYVLAGVQLIITEGLLILLAIVAILFFNAELFLLLLIILVPAVVLMSYLIRRKLRFVKQHIKSSSEKTLQYLQEALTGFVESNLYDKNDFFTQRYASQQNLLNHYLAELQITQGMPSRLIEVFAVFGLFILIWVTRSGHANYVSGFITIGAFMAAAYKIIPGIVKILNTSGQIRTYEHTIEDLAKNNTKPQRKTDSNSFDRINSIAFRNVSFDYHGRKILDRLNFDLKAGNFMGISGFSGRGKTTIINLLLGFLEPDSGHVIINEKESNALGRHAYWKNIAYVKQQTFMMRGSILDNITIGDKKFDEEKLESAIEISGLTDLISHSDQGINKLITENGKNISGGQRQRIAIARAMYKNADLIILDEPFNELDEESESVIMNHLESIRNSGKLIILITHSKKSLSFCNQILSLHEV
ncbi:MAG: hypothetical protein C5B52_05870 [Bacteroidetes bacterium]|nr:MAG: hypothetical protein C5B52_05870 [Bacteroidota bacterium]